MGQWRVKFDGVCSRCGIALHTGEVAVYERPTRTIHCVECPAIDPGVAGRSARQKHEQLTARREERIKGKLGDRLGGVVLAVTSEPQSTRAWAQGARGEEKLARELADFSTLHDRRVPGSRANIDHIVIAPAGVFVVDAKLYTGLIRIRDRGWFLRPAERLYVGSHDCSDLADGLGWQVAAVERALMDANIAPRPRIVPVLCFVDGEWPLIAPPSAFRGVALESAKSIRKKLVAPVSLDEAEIARLTEVIARALPPK
jgi:hypothetical protein